MMKILDLELTFIGIINKKTIRRNIITVLQPKL